MFQRFSNLFRGYINGTFDYNRLNQPNLWPFSLTHKLELYLNVASKFLRVVKPFGNKQFWG